MIERIVIIDNVDPVSFYGVNNSNMQLIRNLFPKLRVTARGSVLRVLGDEDDTALFEQKIKELEAYCAKYNKLTEDVIIDVMRGDKPRMSRATAWLYTVSTASPSLRATITRSFSWRLSTTTT